MFYLMEVALGQCDKALVVWRAETQAYREQSFHGSNNERGVCGIAIPLPLWLPVLMVHGLKIEKPTKRMNSLLVKLPKGGFSPWQWIKKRANVIGNAALGPIITRHRLWREFNHGGTSAAFRAVVELDMQVVLSLLTLDILSFLLTRKAELLISFWTT